jgi:hypothetical protein
MSSRGVTKRELDDLIRTDDVPPPFVPRKKKQKTASSAASGATPSIANASVGTGANFANPVIFRKY